MKNFIKRVETVPEGFDPSNLTRPYKIPSKLYNKFNFYFKLRKYNQSLFEKEQNDIFNSFGLNRVKGIEKLNQIIEKLNIPLIKKRKMSSEHEIIFSSISEDKNRTINNILEIGTFDGFNALLMSYLFPNSSIDTIDLSEDEEDFKYFYNREHTIYKFIKDRDDILSKNKNINFFQMNSLRLLNHKKKYDLIWIDGAHGYPVVCADIINSLHIIQDNGLIICDDIYINNDQIKSDKMYSSIASFETLTELKKEKLINFKLAYKRLDPESNCVENKRKYLGIVNKI